MRRLGLTAKLVAVNLVLLGAVLVIVYLSFEYLAADYFSKLMERYGISPTDTHGMFLEAVHRAMGLAAAIALAGAVVVCTMLTRRILGPLSEMLVESRRIAAGDYRAEITITTGDEVGQLARAFNDMAHSLARVERLRQRLVMDVAHELRTPLTSIQGYLEALRDGVLQPSPTTLASVHEDTVRLARLVEDLLSLARAEASALELERRPVDLARLAREALSSYRDRLAGRSTELVASADGVDVVPGDRAKLERVLRNLLDNAEAHTPPEGEIAIEIRARPEHVEVAVTNTGVPVPADDLPHIFERFYRVDLARSRARGGAGIGLAIAKELVAAHGGEVGAESTGTGMRVWFTLPRCARP